jgi:hypothetical protein
MTKQFYSRLPSNMIDLGDAISGQYCSPSSASSASARKIFVPYDLVLQALPFLYSAMPRVVANAVPLLEKALELEPSYSRAHADSGVVSASSFQSRRTSRAGS